MAPGAARGGVHFQEPLPQQAAANVVALQRPQQVPEQSRGWAESIGSTSQTVTLVGFVGCSLQKQHDGFRDWLQAKEKQSAELDKVRVLLKELQDER